MKTTARKPVGGFVFVSAMGLLATWWAYKRGFIEYRDVRVWLAVHELLAQRCTAREGCVPRFEVRELGRLVGGVGGEHLRASVRRLERAGLLHWSPTAPKTASTLSSVCVGDADDLRDTMEEVTNHRRLVPVPRPLLRFLARDSRPVLAATAMGHLLRCMYYRDGQCRADGWCKSSWVAAVFEVDERNVKAARGRLERMGVLARRPASQTAMNRWGIPAAFNLLWDGGDRSETPPPNTLSTIQTPPPRETGNSSFGRSENQKPGAPDPIGVRKRTGRGPSLARVLVADLRAPHRLLVLLRQARGRGYVGESEADRLAFFAAAERALRLGRRNAPGFFATMVRKGLWHHVSLADESKASQRFREIDTSHQRFERRALKHARPHGSGTHQTESTEDVRVRIRRSLESVDSGVESLSWSSSEHLQKWTSLGSLARPREVFSTSSSPVDVL